MKYLYSFEVRSFGLDLLFGSIEVSMMPRHKLNKSAFLQTITVDFCVPRLRAFGMVSANTL